MALVFSFLFIYHGAGFVAEIFPPFVFALCVRACVCHNLSDWDKRKKNACFRFASYRFVGLGSATSQSVSQSYSPYISVCVGCL